MSAQANRERRHDTPLRRARTCYDHLARLAGVDLLDRMQKRGWRVPHAGARSYGVTSTGKRVVVCFECGWRESAPSLAPAIQRMADHSIETGGDDLLVIPVEKISMLK